jgi:hypothetical protein
MMRKLAAICFGLLTMGTVHAQNQLHDAKPVLMTVLQAEELVAVELDSDIYQSTRPGYPDLRLLTAADKEAAFLVRRKQTKVKRLVKQVWTAKEISLNPRDDGGLEITIRIDLEQHPKQPQGIRLFSRLRNFEHCVRIESSADGETWQPLVEEALIFDYSQFMDVRNLAIELPPSAEDNNGWIRVTIEDVTQEQQSQLIELTRNLQGSEETNRTERLFINRQPFRIDRIAFWHDEMQVDTISDARAEYPLTVARIVEDAEAKQSHIYLESRREPITKLTLATEDRNFTRDARVEVRQTTTIEPDSWQAIGRGNLTRIDFRSLQRESLEIELSEHREMEYRVVIENRDSPPLVVSSFIAEGNVYEAVFLAQPQTDYRLAYGSNTLTAPQFDTAALSAALAEGFTPLGASLGPAVELKVAPTPAEPLLKRLLNSGPLLTIVIVVLVVLMAAGLYRATRNLDKMTES